MAKIKSELEQNGFCILPEIIRNNEAKHMQQVLLKQLNKCAEELDISLSSYLCSASRWAAPSPITESFNKIVNNTIKQRLEASFRTKLTLSKMNIIIKSPYAPSPTPCHQDISYTPNDPYDFSCWLALVDIDSNDAPLMILPNSHLAPISPAVDFWQPDFIDNLRESDNWKRNAIACPIEAGSAIIFDARTWHGSAPLLTSKLRIALVTRWKKCDRSSSKQDIPEIIKKGFGMWTSGEKTHNFFSTILRKPNTTPLITLIDQYLDNYDISLEAAEALSQLKILHMAYEKHNGGDTQGHVYKNVWKHVLSQHHLHDVNFAT